MLEWIPKAEPHPKTGGTVIDVSSGPVASPDPLSPQPLLRFEGRCGSPSRSTTVLVSSPGHRRQSFATRLRDGLDPEDSVSTIPSQERSIPSARRPAASQENRLITPAFEVCAGQGQLLGCQRRRQPPALFATGHRFLPRPQKAALSVLAAPGPFIPTTVPVAPSRSTSASAVIREGPDDE